MGLHWLLRMARWARNPPTMAQLKFVLAILAICFALLAVEMLFGWPDWLTPNTTGRAPRF